MSKLESLVTMGDKLMRQYILPDLSSPLLLLLLLLLVH